MTALPQEIVKFIQKHHVMTLAVTDDGRPYCASCFFIFYHAGPELVFLSDKGTWHGQKLLQNCHAAANIHLETREINRIQGVQITGKVFELSNEDQIQRTLYHKSFPEARNVNSTLWKMQIDFIKMSDNTVSFGFKRIWNRK